MVFLFSLLFQVIGTGQNIHRAWYDTAVPVDADNLSTADSTVSNSQQQNQKMMKYAPNMMLSEPGAVLCRLSKSFLRFGQLELFALRSEFNELLQLADYTCFREYPHLLDIVVPHTSNRENMENIENAEVSSSRSSRSSGSSDSNDSSDSTGLPAKLIPGPVERYVSLYRCIAQRTARLVASWLRVGYVQGNMNSDNTHLGGATIDYGPYGWMEKYDPLYQPFTSDRSGNFAFARQPNAMHLNVAVLGETFILLPISQIAVFLFFEYISFSPCLFVCLFNS